MKYHYQLKVKLDGQYVSKVCGTIVPNLDLRPLYADFVHQQAQYNHISFLEAEEIVSKSIKGSNYRYL